MSKTRTTLTVDQDVLRAVRIKAARTGKRDSQVIEESLRRDLGLDELDRLWASVQPATEAEGLDLAYTELHAMREEGRAAGSS
jgi:gamma-glutamyl:cysteine ligase YbdK (ATP-grasp superfamily)